MKKGMKKILKYLGIIVLIVLVLLLAYIIYLFASYHRIPDNQPLQVEQTKESISSGDTLTTEKEYSALTYNIGFGAYTPDFSFFMDGGKSSWAKSKESVKKTVQSAGELVASKDPDFALIEEVDLNSTRSYHVDEYSILKETIPSYNTVFAQNYDSAFLFYPLNQPHGKSRSGLALFSKYPVTDSLRRSFPVSTSFSKFFDLDRCYSISRVPTDNGKELVIFLLHMSAYGNSDAIREWLKSCGASKVVIHFDMDVLDPAEIIAAVGTDPDGMKIEEVIRVIKDIAAEKELVGLTIAEPMPRTAIRIKNMLHQLPLL